MKKSTKWCLILAGFCGGIGLILMICASLLGASLSDMMRNNEFSVFKTKSGWHVGWEREETEFTDEKGTNDGMSAQAVIDTKEVRKLEIDIDAANIIFMTGSDEDQIRIQSSGEYETFTAKVHANTLEIKEKDEEFLSLIGGYWDRTIEVHIPEGFVFDEADLEMDAGSIEGEGLNVAGKLKIDVDAGSVELSEVTMGALEIEADAGSVVLYDSVLKGNAKISTAAGSAELHLESNETDFNYKIECDMGSVNINEKEWSGMEKKVSIDNDAKFTINVECDMGSVDIYTP